MMTIVSIISQPVNIFLPSLGFYAVSVVFLYYSVFANMSFYAPGNVIISKSTMQN